MSTKKVSYIDLLKEAVQNYGHDTSKTVDSKGPFVDSILSYKGDGELQTYKDASSILERYYFDKETDADVESLQEVTQEEPLGDDEKEPIEKAKKEIEKEVTENEEVSEDEELEISESEETNESNDVSEIENSIVEKLIEEMESEDESVSEMGEYKGQGTKAAGAGDAEKHLKNEAKDEMKEEEQDEEELDVDKELKEWGTGILEQDEEDEEENEKEEKEEEKEKEKEEEKQEGKKAKNEAGPVGGPLGYNKSSGIKKGKYDYDNENLEEQFSLFKKQIQESDNENVEDIDSNDVIV